MAMLSIFHHCDNTYCDYIPKVSAHFQPAIKVLLNISLMILYCVQLFWLLSKNKSRTANRGWLASSLSETTGREVRLRRGGRTFPPPCAALAAALFRIVSAACGSERFIRSFVVATLKCTQQHTISILFRSSLTLPGGSTELCPWR